MRSLLPLALVLVGSFAAPQSAAGESREFLSVEEALELAFPECELERSSVFLTKEQRKAAEKLACEEIDSRMELLFTATSRNEDGAPTLAGWAYVDSHLVRTKRETLLVVLGPDSRIRRLEVLAFAEPREYLPRAKWYAQFVGKELDEDLRIKGDIRGVTGATLTARATTSAVRRVLAVHLVAGPGKQEKAAR